MPLEGIEKLRDIGPGGVGRGDAVCGALGGVCLALKLKWSCPEWPLDANGAEFGTNGAEWATKLENAVFLDAPVGGRGSS